jgi:hypothetical protein
MDSSGLVLRERDETFGNRFDDFDGYFRVLYAGSSPLTCFVETLARYRKPPNLDDLVNALNSIENSGEDQPPFGRIPLSWVNARTLGEAVSSRRRLRGRLALPSTP